jgi:hypothetical protein
MAAPEMTEAKVVREEITNVGAEDAGQTEGGPEARSQNRQMLLLQIFSRSHAP